MKKKNTYGTTIRNSLIIILCFISNLVMSQSDCPDPSAGDFLEVNNVKAWIRNDQRQFFDGFYDGPDLTYEIPIGSGINAFFVTNLWIAGRTPDNTLKIAADNNTTEESRFLPGPLNDNAMVDEELCEIYNRLYIIRRDMSETHYSYFQSLEAGTVAEDFPDGYQLPQVLLDYPGSIYTSTGLNEHGAPYYDYNEDGLYDATQGDFPLFSGMFGEYDCESCETLNGDVCFYWINNDMRSFEDQEPIGIEIHNMVYAFSSDDAVNNTLFFQKKIINRGVQTLQDTYVGIWADPDVGCWDDDFAGCDVMRNLGVVYNSDNNDEDCGTDGYGEMPPTVGVLGLQLPFEGPDGSEETELKLSGFSTHNLLATYPQSYPWNAEEFYNNLLSRWQNGEPFTYGGTGIGGTQEASFLFPHNTDPEGTGTGGVPQLEWSEITEGNFGGDRRFLMSFGPFTMDPGEVNCFTYATIYAENDGNENPLNAIQIVADEISTSFDNCFEDIIIGINENEVVDIAIVQWNISNSVLNVNPKNNETLTILLMDDIGRLVKSIETNDERTINLSGVASGLYVVNIINQKGTKQSEKIVKL